MPRKPAGDDTPKKDSTKVPFKGYVNLTLTDDEKEAFEHERLKPELYTLIYADALREGYNMSVKWLSSERCFRASLTCTDANSPAFGWILAMRASDPHTAAERVLYTHHHILGDDWSDHVGTRRSDTDW